MNKGRRIQNKEKIQNKRGSDKKKIIKSDVTNNITKNEKSYDKRDKKSDNKIDIVEYTAENQELEHSAEKIEDSSKKAYEEEDFNKDIDEIQNKQVKWVLFLMIAIILIVVLVFFVKNNFIDKFNYKGLVFQKTQIGNLFFYSTRFPVVSSTGKIMGEYAVNFRNDPRKLDYIPVNTTNIKIEFTLDKGGYGPVFISLNPFMEVCEDSGIALLTLSGFLRDSGLNVSSAVTDKAYAKKNKLTQRWCDDDKFDTVIIVTNGNETSITEISPNCYEMKFNKCEIMQVNEKFIMVILEDYASRFKIS